MLKKESWMQNSLTSLEPRSERSSPYYSVSEYRFLWDVVFDRWSTRKNIRFHRKAFLVMQLLAYSRGLLVSRICPILWRTLLPLHASALLNWLLQPSSDFSMSSRFPIQRNSNPFCWSCASTLRSRQQILVPQVQDLMQADTNSPKVRRMQFLCFPFNFRTLLASFHAASRAHRSCHSVSSWDRSSNFGGLVLRWWGSPGQIIPSDGFWSRMLAWRTTALANRTHRIGFSMFELFLQIDEDFGGSKSWHTQPNCRVLDESYTTGLSVLSCCSSFST